MFLHFKISSKDNQVLQKFLQFLQKLKTLPTSVTHFSKQKKRKFVTILKSPHVNKTAQEQFEFRFYNKEFLVRSSKPLTFLTTIKKIKNLSFPSIKLEVKGSFNQSQKDKSLSKALDPDTIILSQRNSQIFCALELERKYIQLFDGYGEFCLKKSFLRKKTFNNFIKTKLHL